MSSILPPGPGLPPFTGRLRRRERVLGVLAELGQVSPDLVRGLDFLLVSDLAHVDGARAVVGGQTPVLVVVTTAEEAGAARAVGADGLVAMSTDVGGVEVDVVMSESGRGRVVTSAQDARSAFASGAEVVVYDLPSMLAATIAGLPGGRPFEAAPSGREPLVLLSGMLCDETLWDGFAELASDDVLPWPIRIDLDDSVPEMAASVLAQAPARFSLGGHSLGAIVALEVIRQAPERVGRLLLVNASARGPSQVQQEAWERWHTRTVDGELEQIAHELSSPSLGPASRQDPEQVRAVVDMALTVGAEGFLRQLSAQSTRPDSLPSLSSITVPVLVVSGEADEICPPALQQELAEGCDGAALVTVAGAGHLLPLEAPDALADAVRTWLSGRQ